MSLGCGRKLEYRENICGVLEASSTPNLAYGEASGGSFAVFTHRLLLISVDFIPGGQAEKVCRDYEVSHSDICEELQCMSENSFVAPAQYTERKKKCICVGESEWERRKNVSSPGCIVPQNRPILSSESRNFTRLRIHWETDES
ncbi:unnamed protein product [Pleuronectes platessa]|uniref:Uncharacterized protein n=1 Tax=Pleuronectes platessa TaxID=8262 RepID=A0A9N7YLP3_PLEPL|nr:unnamed protein product [Pleuronectes platessa]